MDQFYSLVTGQEDAFYQMCMVLPGVIEKAVASSAASVVPKDSVIDELNEIAKSKDGTFALALYMLGFKSYTGFKPESQSYGLQDSSFLTVNEKVNNAKCDKCGLGFQWCNKGDIYPGGRAKENIVCPHCGNIFGNILTSGYIYTE